MWFNLCKECWSFTFGKERHRDSWALHSRLPLTLTRGQALYTRIQLHERRRVRVYRTWEFPLRCDKSAEEKALKELRQPQRQMV